MIFILSIFAGPLRQQLKSARTNSDIAHIHLTEPTGGILIAEESDKARLPESDAFQAKVLSIRQWKSSREENILRMGGPVLLPDSTIGGYLFFEFSLERIRRIGGGNLGQYCTDARRTRCGRNSRICVGRALHAAHSIDCDGCNAHWRQAILKRGSGCVETMNSAYWLILSIRWHSRLTPPKRNRCAQSVR